MVAFFQVLLVSTALTTFWATANGLSCYECNSFVSGQGSCEERFYDFKASCPDSSYQFCYVSWFIRLESQHKMYKTFYFKLKTIQDGIQTLRGCSKGCDPKQVKNLNCCASDLCNSSSSLKFDFFLASCVLLVLRKLF